MDNYCRSLQNTDFSGFCKFREVYSAQSSFLLAVGINLLELACKFKGTKLGSQIFECLERLIDSNTGENIDSVFRNLLNVLKNASYVDGIIWLEHYLCNNVSNLLASICNCLISGLGISCYEASQDMLDFLSEKLEVSISIENYLKSSDIQQNPIINLYFTPNSSIFYILYSEKLINFYQHSEIPYLFTNPVKKPSNSESLISTLIQILSKKNLSGPIKTQLLEYKLETKDPRLNPLTLSPDQFSILSTFPATQFKCSACANPTQDTTPITFCSTHPYCLSCLLNSHACPKCSLVYPSFSISFLHSLVNN